MPKLVFLSTMIVASLISGVETADAKTIYVTPGGNDSAAGTQAAPVKTIQRGADLSRAGDTVLVAPGIYYERAIGIRNSGTSAAPITLKAAGGGKSIMDHGLRVSGWTAAVGGAFAGQALFVGSDTAANNTIVRVVIDGTAYRKVALGTVLTAGNFTATPDGLITVVPVGGASPAGRDVIVLSEGPDSLVGLLLFDDASGGTINNIIVDGFTHRAANTAIWGARFSAPGAPQPVNRNLTVKNCEIAFNWQYAFRLDNWVGATMRNCDVYENGQVNWPRGENNVIWPHAIIGFNGDRVNILDSKVHDNHGEGVGPYFKSSFWVIRNNEIYDNYSVNVYVDTDEGNVIVDRNLIYLTGKYTAPGAFGSSKAQFSDGIRIANEIADFDLGDVTPLVNNVVVTNNVIIGTGDGIMSYPYANERGVTGKSGLINSLIANNTVVNTTTGQGTFQTGINISVGQNVSVINNISYPQRIRVGTTAIGQVTAANNLVKDAAGIEIFGNATQAQNLFGIPGFTVGTGFTALNYQLSLGALGINGGRSSLRVKTDFSGITRPVGGAFDVGAFER